MSGMPTDPEDLDRPGAGPLFATAQTATDYWNDSCSIEELRYAIERGAMGATSNPTIVGQVLAQEMDRWRPWIEAMIAERPRASEDEIAWLLVEEMAREAAALLEPVFAAQEGRKGLLSIQTDPRLYRDPERLVEQGLRFARLAPNMQVKVPATAAGIEAIEALTAAGVPVNATVCFTVPQAIAVAEAVERGLAARDAAAPLPPVCTIMVGRLDDWLGLVAARDGIVTDPETPGWAGIAVFKNAYRIYRERGYRTRLLAAAYRHHRHWTELVGGDVVLTIPWAWQRRFNLSGLEPVARIDEPVPPGYLAQLRSHFPDFLRAFEPDGLTVAEFDSYPATVRTLRGFIASYHELVAVIRGTMLPDVDHGS